MTTTHDDELDELFNKTIVAKKIAVETVLKEEVLFDNDEIANAANLLLQKYRDEFRATIKARELAARKEQAQRDLDYVILNGSRSTFYIKREISEMEKETNGND